MTSEFVADVESKIGPLLERMGFVVDEIDESPDEGGLERNIVYCRSHDCKMQIYYYRREGEINCMIAPLDAPNEFGLDSKKWYFINHFSKRLDIPPKERLKLAIAEMQSYATKLDWLQDRITKHYEAAHAGILEKYGSSQ